MSIIDIPNKPKEYTKWDNNKFILKLKAVENLLKYNNRYKDSTDYVCTVCKKKIHNIIYKSVKYKWPSALYHLVNEHNYKPEKDFISYIDKYNINIPTSIKRVVKFMSKQYTIDSLKYIKLNQNQLMIFDALMEHGGYTKKYHSYSKKKLHYRHSEHSGLLDFDNTGLERVIVSGKTDRKDPNDTTIFLPQNMEDAIDYEYIFHTHPPTPKPGGRAKEGILYEFPSISDLFHFIDHYNDGVTQGSIIICPEGLYNIRKIDFNDKKINIDENKLYNKMIDVTFKIQDDALHKYGEDFTEKSYYSNIAQDRKFINKFNNALTEFGLTVDYFPRTLDKNGRWILQEVFLPVQVVERHKKQVLKQ